MAYLEKNNSKIPSKLKKNKNYNFLNMFDPIIDQKEIKEALKRAHKSGVAQKPK